MNIRNYIFSITNIFLLLILDILLFNIALFFAYLLRFEFSLSKELLKQIFNLIPIIILIKATSFYSFVLYKGMWRYISLSDLWRLIQATTVSTLGITSIILFSYRFAGFSRAVFLIDWGLTILLSGGLRITVRVVNSKGLLKWNKNSSSLDKAKDGAPFSKRRQVVIVGAGSAGEKLVREINENIRLGFKVAAFVDDDLSKLGRTIHGIKVMGTVDSIPDVVNRLDAEQVLISIPSATGQQIRRIINKCESVAVPFKIVPGLGELAEGKVSIKDLRDVNYEDLLSRPPVHLDQEAISSYLSGKRVMITGAGGSIGSELCRQIAKLSPEIMVLVDFSESSLFKIQMELRHRFGFQNFTTVLADIKNRPTIGRVLSKYRPNVVVHAAAFKHVPMLERNPWEAVINNVIGTHNLIQEVVAANTSRLVMVSTDKAVRPTNVMGASKRVCELFIQAFQGENGCNMMCVRFGNVIGSAGSVVPLFREQIARGGPVTVTDPRVTRVFMTIPEACQLILQAGALGKGGEVFILEMGSPVRILDMARDLIRLSGKDPDKDIEIVFTGLRPGEKLHEELITVGEDLAVTAHKKIMVLRTDGNWNGHESQEDFRNWLLEKTAELKEAALACDPVMIRSVLKKIVPEYDPFYAESVL